MSTVQTWQIDSTSLSDTLNLAEQFGQRCKGGEIFELASDLGGGKTAFVKGLAKGLGCTATVGSPTFTITREYPARDGLTLQHFDFYRLQDPGVVALELSEFIEDPQTVIAIEWAGIVQDVLPALRVRVEMERTGENSRLLTITVPAELAYLNESINK